MANGIHRLFQPPSGTEHSVFWVYGDPAPALVLYQARFVERAQARD